MGENRKDNRQIKFRVNDLEFQKLEQMAQASGMSVPTFCKKQAQGARQLRAIGNNVNQLSKRANEGAAVPKEEV
ncbi:plasmid mobilization protein [Planococcus kocurii]|uniref:plasmid mobilization protein n=1 Tax=Planococcus kocurii TaxID=1374 RepID=UPI003CFF5CD6